MTAQPGPVQTYPAQVWGGGVGPGSCPPEPAYGHAPIQALK